MRHVVRLPHLWVIVSLAGIFILLSMSLIGPADFWWHVRAGQWIAENSRVPTVDLWSYTRLGEPWTYQAWLMELVFFLLLRAGDLPLVILFHAIVITAGYSLLLLLNRRAANGDLRRAAIATMVAAAWAIDNWNIRPQTISFLFFPLTLVILERSNRDPISSQLGRSRHRLIWALPLVFALWANAHGGFVFGLTLLGTYLIADLVAWLRREKPFPLELILGALVATAATMLTPVGIGMVDYVLSFWRHPVTRTMNVEFWPPDIQTRNGQVFFCLILIWLALLLISRYRPTRRESARLLLFGALALMSRRNIAWFGFVAAPTIAASLTAWSAHRGPSRSQRRGNPRLNVVILALIGLLVILSLPWFRPILPVNTGRYTYLTSDTPVEAVERLRELSPPPRTFHTEIYGSYMIWASPEAPVFIDTRFELYPPEQWADYMAIITPREDWKQVLEQYHVDTLLLSRDSLPHLIRAAGSSPDWELLYEDEEAVVFHRVTGSTGLNSTLAGTDVVGGNQVQSRSSEVMSEPTAESTSEGAHESF